MNKTSLKNLDAPRNVELLIKVVSVEEEEFIFSNQHNVEYLINIPKNNSWSIYNPQVNNELVVILQDYGIDNSYTRMILLKIN